METSLAQAGCVHSRQHRHKIAVAIVAIAAITANICEVEEVVELFESHVSLGPFFVAAIQVFDVRVCSASDPLRKLGRNETPRPQHAHKVFNFGVPGAELYDARALDVTTGTCPITFDINKGVQYANNGLKPICADFNNCASSSASVIRPFLPRFPVPFLPPFFPVTTDPESMKKKLKI